MRDARPKVSCGVRRWRFERSHRHTVGGRLTARTLAIALVAASLGWPRASRANVEMLVVAPAIGSNIYCAAKGRRRSETCRSLVPVLGFAGAALSVAFASSYESAGEGGSASGTALVLAAPLIILSFVNLVTPSDPEPSASWSTGPVILPGEDGARVGLMVQGAFELFE